MWLAVETSTKLMGVAVVDRGRCLSSYELLADYPHAVELPGAVTRALAAAKTSLDKLDGIAVDLGPGSFTGLRIGLAFAKALAYPRKIPMVGVVSLDILAANVPFADRAVITILDARQGNLYAAIHRWKDGRFVRQGEPVLAPAADLIKQWREPAIFLGDGIPLYKEAIEKQCPEPSFAPAEFWLPRAATVGRLGMEKFAADGPADAAHLLPLYLYPMDCAVRGPDRPTSVLPKPSEAPAPVKAS